jgi:DUF4097 and DUF4098 domain-containing protein YvlB
MRFILLNFIPLFFVLLFIKDIFANNDDKLIANMNVTTSPGKKLKMNVYAGGVKIETWNKNEVEVKVYGNDNAENYFSYSANSDDEGVVVKSELKSDYSHKKNFNLTTEFKISVPADYNLEINTGGGNISISNLTGNVALNTAGGNLKLTKITGDVHATTSGGNLKYEDIRGNISSTTSGGNVKIYKFNGNVDVATSGGNMELEGANGSIDASTSGGNIKLQYVGKNQGIELNSAAGNISVRVPEDFDAEADLYTTVGSINSDFAKVDNESMSSKLKVRLNNGGNKLKCVTSAGNISLTK